jgi:hypothetical protein
MNALRRGIEPLSPGYQTGTITWSRERSTCQVERFMIFAMDNNYFAKNALQLTSPMRRELE